jgi:hypothetical protein
MTLFTFPPEPSTISGVGIQSEQVKFLLQGQSGAPYVIQSTTNLAAGWTPVSTNTLAGDTTNISIAISTNLPQQFYRAVWRP